MWLKTESVKMSMKESEYWFNEIKTKVIKCPQNYNCAFQTTTHAHYHTDTNKLWTKSKQMLEKTVS